MSGPLRSHPTMRGLAVSAAPIRPFIDQVTLALPPWVGQGLSLVVAMQTLARGQDYVSPTGPPAETLEHLNVHVMGWLLLLGGAAVIAGLFAWVLHRWALPLLAAHALCLAIYGALLVGIVQAGWHADHYWRAIAQVLGGGFVNVVMCYGLNRARQLQQFQVDQ
jgi:hypothetical protein